MKKVLIINTAPNREPVSAQLEKQGESFSKSFIDDIQQTLNSIHFLLENELLSPIEANRITARLELRINTRNFNLFKIDFINY